MAAAEHFAVKFFAGDVPRLRDNQAIIHDYQAGKVYHIGGMLVSDEVPRPPTADIYSINIASDVLTWRNHTHYIETRKPNAHRYKKRCIPRLAHPGSTLFRANNKSYILLFGGYDFDITEEADRVTARLIMLDPDPNSLRWWFAPVQGGNPRPRVSPTMVGIRNRLYIFSGFNNLAEDPQEAEIHYSYSIVEYRDAEWHWVVCDEPYPALAQGHRFQNAIAVGGKKILLTPASDDKCDISKNNLLFFQVDGQEFQNVYLYGDFPRDVNWYTCYPISNDEDSWSVILCAWFPWPEGTDEASPELWHLRLSSQDERIECLGVVEKVGEADSDLQYSFMAGKNRLVLMGHEPTGENSTSPKFNIYMNVQIQT